MGKVHHGGKVGNAGRVLASKHTSKPAKKHWCLPPITQTMVGSLLTKEIVPDDDNDAMRMSVSKIKSILLNFGN